MAEPRTIVGDKDIRSGSNDAGADIAKNLFVEVDAASSENDGVQLPASAGNLVYGVTMEAIPQAPTGGDPSQPVNRGDIQIRGVAVVTASAAIAKGANVGATTAGKARTAVTGDRTAGVALTAAAVDGDLIEVELAGPGGGVITP